jgi:hypothetical protein
MDDSSQNLPAGISERNGRVSPANWAMFHACTFCEIFFPISAKDYLVARVSSDEPSA